MVRTRHVLVEDHGKIPKFHQDMSMFRPLWKIILYPPQDSWLNSQMVVYGGLLAPNAQTLPRSFEEGVIPCPKSERGPPYTGPSICSDPSTGWTSTPQPSHGFWNRSGTPRLGHSTWHATGPLACMITRLVTWGSAWVSSNGTVEFV